MSASTISTIILVVFFVCLIIGFLRGIFKGAIKSGLDAGVALLSAIVTLPLTKGLTRVIVDSSILNLILDKLLGVLPSSVGFYVESIKAYLENEATVKSVTEIAELIAAIPTILLSPILFILIFLVIFGILSIVSTVIKMLVCPETKKIGFRIIGGVLSAAAYIVVLFVVIIPVTGYSNLASSVSSHCLEVIDENEKSKNENLVLDLSIVKAPLKAVVEYTEPITSNQVSRVMYAIGGKAIFSSLTTTKIDGVKLDVEVEANGAIDICSSAIKFLGVEPKNYSKEQSDAINEINDAICDSEYLALLTSKLVSFIANEYYQGNDIFGIEKPNLGKDFNPTFDKVLRVLKDTDSNDIRKDLRTISNIANGALEAGVIKEVTSAEINVWEIVENEDLIELIFVELYINTRTRNMIPYLTSAATNYVYEMYDDVNNTYTDPGKFDYSNYNEQQLAKEATYIANAIKEIHLFIEQANFEEGFDPKLLVLEVDLGTLGRGLENLRESMFTERIFKLLLHAALHSEAITQTGIIDQTLINNVEKENSNLAEMLVARQNVIKLAISIQEKGDSEQTKELMDSVIESILKNDDDLIGSIVSKDKLGSLGMSENDATSIEGIVGSIIDGAKDCEFENDEEKVEEIKKAETIISAVGNTVLDKKEDNVFTTGEGDSSSTNMTAKDFVDSVTDSKLTSSIVQNAVKGENGETVEDPYNIQKELSDNDKEEISQAIKENYAKEDLTEEERKTLEALANIFGVTIQ